MGLPDPLAVAALIWPEYVLEVTDCYGVVCTNENEPSYGQVIFYQKGMVYEAMPEIGDYNVQVVSAVDETYFMEHFLSVFTD